MKKAWNILAVVGIIIILGGMLMLVGGCAHGVVKDGEGNIILEVDSEGFGRDSVFYKKLPDGTVIYYSSKSNIAGVIGEINEAVGTASGLARDVMP